MAFYVAVFGVFDVVDVAFFSCRVILRHIECIKVEEARFHLCTCHFLETQLHQFSADFIEEAQVRMLLAGPSFGDGCFYVVFLEFDVAPFACDYEFRG